MDIFNDFGLLSIRVDSCKFVANLLVVLSIN
jgi:hypothetical protein